jgi:hypothetical protein
MFPDFPFAPVITTLGSLGVNWTIGLFGPGHGGIEILVFISSANSEKLGRDFPSLTVVRRMKYVFAMSHVHC